MAVWCEGSVASNDTSYVTTFYSFLLFFLIIYLYLFPEYIRSICGLGENMQTSCSERTHGMELISYFIYFYFIIYLFIYLFIFTFKLILFYSVLIADRLVSTTLDSRMISMLQIIKSNQIKRNENNKQK